MGEAKKIVLEQFQSAPAELGVRMPAEWERHEATWLVWPHPAAASRPGLSRRLGDAKSVAVFSAVGASEAIFGKT
jgi:Peptidylarginine deiminase and related enzymes